MGQGSIEGNAGWQRSERIALCCALAALLLSACSEELPSSQAVPIGGTGGIDPNQVDRVVPIKPIPINGVLPLGVFRRAPVVRVSSRDAQRTISGTVREVAGYWAWFPSEPLELGTVQVALELFDSDGISSQDLGYSIQVVAPYMRRAPGLVSEPSASLLSTPIESACCSGWNGFELTTTFCSAVSYQDRVLFGPGLISPDPDVALRQHVFAIYRALPDAERKLLSISQWQQWGELIFDEQADEYCFEIEATDFSTGELYRYRNLTPSCAEHGSLPDLARHDAELTDDSLDRFLCEVPPPRYEERWCELNEAECLAAPGAQGCERSGYVCRGESLPEPELGGAGVSAETDGVAGMGSALELPMGDSEQVIVVGSEPADCSAASSPARARATPLAWLALLGLPRLMRRRRAQQARAFGSSST
jgi:hypothetical protein